MAFSNILTTRATFLTSKLNLHFSNLPRFPLSPFTARYFSISTIAHPDLIEKKNAKNPLMTEGPVGFFETEEDGEAMYWRADLPGICKEGLKLKVVNREVFIEAEEVERERQICKKDEKPGKYKGSIEFLGPLRMDKMKAQIKNGELRIVVPKIKGEEMEGVFDVKID